LARLRVSVAVHALSDQAIKTVRNSSFKTMFDGVSQDGFLQSSLITIGGSPSAGNRFENLYVGMDMEGSESSNFDISYNESSGIYASMWVIPWQPVFVPSSPLGI
jgi:hypothetical protein